jgi:signal peptidase I
MEPAIKTGSIVLVKPISDYKTNDIITFELRGENVTHRVYEEKTMNNTESYITKGDANNASDMKEVKKENVIGKVFVSIPYLGYGVNFIQGAMHKPFIFFSFIFGLLVLVIIQQVKGIRNEMAKNKLKQADIK